MGVATPPLHRRLNMRNPFTRPSSFTRACVAAVVMLTFLALALQSSTTDLRRAWLIRSQKPISSTSFFRPGKNRHPSSSSSQGQPIRYNGTSSWDETLGCDEDVSHLRTLKERYGLQDEFEYLKRHVRIHRRDDVKRKSLTDLDQVFAPKSTQFRVVDTKGGRAKEMHSCPEPLEVPVSSSPFPSAANLTDFMFGVSTTYSRFTDPRTSPVDEWSYWLTDSAGNSNGGKLVLLLVNATRDQLKDAGSRLGRAGIDADVYRAEPDDIMAVRYMSLVPAMYNHPARSRKKWLVVCDDDTFFPYPNLLVDKILGDYDHTRPMYIGTLSEDINNVARHGSQAFGGAGVFISVPLAAKISANFGGCSSAEKVKEADSGWGPQGDILLRKCIYENTDVRLTYLRELWQVDLTGDPSGFYESGLQPLSLHHYRGGGFWPLAHPFQYTKAAHLCGEDCTLQRFRTADGWVLSAGFSVVQYPVGDDAWALDLQQLERTFSPAPDDKGWNLDYVFGPQRPSLHRTGRKISWDLQDSAVRRHEDGRISVSQTYVRKRDDGRWEDGSGTPMRVHDGIIELVWIS